MQEGHLKPLPVLEENLPSFLLQVNTESVKAMSSNVTQSVSITSLSAMAVRTARMDWMKVATVLCLVKLSRAPKSATSPLKDL